jgi:nucleotide-binding universal stress UspA family protein
MTILATTEGDTVPDPAVRQGYELARQYDEDLVVLSVLKQETYEERWENQPDYIADDGLADAAETARDVVDATLEDPQNVSVESRIGDPVEEIVDVAADTDATYVVIAGRKRSPVGKAVFGSHTQSLILNTDRPVVVVGLDA